MMKLLKKIKVNKEGASAAEYALMIAVMGGVVVAAVIALGGGIGTALTGATANIASANAP
jgi:pilus assembly protein Flp/PilA